MGSEADDVIELRVGEEHSVELAGLGTAGYRWTHQLEGDREVADVRAAGSVPVERGEAVGAGANEVFAIRANRPGTARIRFLQRRPWEQDDVPPAGERTIRLRVT